MAQPHRVYHWKHGWIPLDATAAAEKEHGDPIRGRARLAAAALLQRTTAVEPQVTADLQREADASGGTLVGLKHKLKTLPSLTGKLVRKADQKGLPIEKVKVSDALRYTMQFPTRDYTRGVRDTTTHLQAKGYRVDTEENNWVRGTVYKGINAEVTSPNGQATFELQFHTPESFAQKRNQHDDYEVARDPREPVLARKAAQHRMAMSWNNVPIPPAVAGVGTIVEPKSLF